MPYDRAAQLPFIPDVALADQDPGVMNGLGQTQLED